MRKITSIKKTINETETESTNDVTSPKTEEEISYKASESNVKEPLSPSTSTTTQETKLEQAEEDNAKQQQEKEETKKAEQKEEKKNESENEEKKSTNFWTECSKVMEVIKLLPLTVNLIRPQMMFILISYALSLLETGLGMLRPKYVGNIVDIVTRSKDSTDLQHLVISMVIFSISSRFISRVSDRVKTKVTEAFRRNVKGELYKKILERDMSFFDKITPNEAADAMSSGVDTLEDLYFYRFIYTLQQVLSVVGNIWLMYITCPRLALIVMVVTPAKFLMTFLSIKSSSNYYKDIGKLWCDVWTLPNQAIMNISLVKAFSTEKREHKDFVGKQEELSQYEYKHRGGFFDFYMLINLIEDTLGAVLVWFGGMMAFQGQVTPGDLSTFNLYYSSFSDSFFSINYTFKWLFESFLRSEKILKILQANNEKDKPKQESKAIIKPDLRGSITVNNLSFSYPSKPEVEVLKNINLQINAGESVAFVGASGSGKTTMVSLLQNLYTLSKGDIIIDGENIYDYDVNWLHQLMGYVSQEPILLDKTIEENIGYGLDNYLPEQIDKALTLSNSRFILDKEKFPDGLKTKIGAEGVKMSGGQKQRIAIARAFVKDPKILILDEPTSALDGESESQVQKAIDELTSFGDRTVIVVAHRLSTIINCSKIVVFENGQIVEEGSHRELIEKNGAYKKLFEFQMSSMKKL